MISSLRMEISDSFIKYYGIEYFYVTMYYIFSRNLYKQMLISKTGKYLCKINKKFYYRNIPKKLFNLCQRRNNFGVQCTLSFYFTRNSNLECLMCHIRAVLNHL